MSALTLFCAAGVVDNLNQLRMRGLVAREMRALIACEGSERGLVLEQMAMK